MQTCTLFRAKVIIHPASARTQGNRAFNQVARVSAPHDAPEARPMSLDDDIRVLTGVDLFDGFTQEQLRLLAFGAENTRLPAGNSRIDRR